LSALRGFSERNKNKHRIKNKRLQVQNKFNINLKPKIIAKHLLANRLFTLKVMPIDYSKYPPDWSEIRQRILERAENKCECCGLKNKSKVVSYLKNGVRVWEDISWQEWKNLNTPKQVTVVLTIAHLDHDETNHNVNDDRLKAMCQLCHLRYDSEEKKRRRNLMQTTS
jgi:hypothetical protein